MITGVMLLTLLATTSAFWMRAEPDEGCWYQDKLCDNSNGANIITTPTNTETAKACYDQCKTHAETLGNSDDPCKHFRWSRTFIQGKWSGTCVLLRECVPGDCLANLCTSGPAECKDIPEPCPQLNRANAAAGKVTWDCGATLNPYNSPIADGIICTARCPAWVDEAGEPVSVSHKCEGGAPGVDGEPGTPGTWGSPFYNGNEATDQSPIDTNPAPTINDPSEETACSADCAEYPLWYDPNSERGARFYCIPKNLDFSNLATEDVKLPKDGECFLFCDNVLVADIFCNNRQWTDISQNPEVGISCFGPVPSKPSP